MEQKSHYDYSRQSSPNRSRDPSQSQPFVYSHENATPSSTTTMPLVSIIIPTYNESKNILGLIQTIRSCIGIRFSTEVIVVDDNSPDKTASLVEKYAHNLDCHDNYQQDRQDNSNGREIQQIFSIRVILRESKLGLVSALVEGINSSLGMHIVVLDADFSHPPNVVVDMINELLNFNYDIVSASRYLKGGRIIGWPLRRRIISKSATILARTILRLNHITDPISGFFAFRRDLINHISFSTSGYKLLLELLVKADNTKVKEIPYTFTDRKAGSSKLDSEVILDYIKALLHLYAFKNSKSTAHKRKKEVSKEKQWFSNIFDLSKVARAIRFLRWQEHV